VANPDQDITPNAVESYLPTAAQTRQARIVRSLRAWGTLEEAKSRDGVHQPPIHILAGGAAHVAGACAALW